MRVVVGLGGNALLRRDDPPDARIQEDRVEKTVDALGAIAEGNELVITHGNGPQIGILASESQADLTLERPYPFDALGAQTQGMIGYWLVRALRNALPNREVIGIITETLVDANDSAFARPKKFVGTTIDPDSAAHLAQRYGWHFEKDTFGLRRVVASPEPLEILEASVVERLIGDGTVVVCAGGGGVPVARGENGRLIGIEAVIDKDLTTGLLAVLIGADVLVLVTDVPGVMRGFGTDEAFVLSEVTPAELGALGLPAGSMGPKARAAATFSTRTAKRAVIGALEDLEDLVAGRAGTSVRSARRPPN